TRAQADKRRYRERMRAALEAEPNLSVRQAEVAEILVDGGRARGVATTAGVAYAGRAVILTTGTFLRGLIHVGEAQSRRLRAGLPQLGGREGGGGRAGEAPGMPLSARRARPGSPRPRFKAAPPCRIDGRTIAFAGLAEQPGDDPAPRFRVFAPPGERPPLPQRSCYLTYTTAETHDIIRRNLGRSPLYAGRIEGVGPRYCPSIEHKVLRFADHPPH